MTGIAAYERQSSAAEEESPEVSSTTRLGQAVDVQAADTQDVIQHRMEAPHVSELHTEWVSWGCLLLASARGFFQTRAHAI